MARLADCVDSLYSIILSASTFASTLPGAVADGILLHPFTIAAWFVTLAAFAIRLYRRRPAGLAATIMLSVFTVFITASFRCNADPGQNSISHAQADIHQSLYAMTILWSSPQQPETMKPEILLTVIHKNTDFSCSNAALTQYARSRLIATPDCSPDTTIYLHSGPIPADLLKVPPIVY